MAAAKERKVKVCQQAKGERRGEGGTLNEVTSELLYKITWDLALTNVACIN